MLPKAALVRKAIESLYDGVASITTQSQTVDPATGRVKSHDVTITGVACRISYKSVSPASDGGGIVAAGQTVTLFTNPDIVIKAGADITVEHRGRTLRFKAVGLPAVYDSHQEVPLESRTVHNG